MKLSVFLLACISLFLVNCEQVSSPEARTNVHVAEDTIISHFAHAAYELTKQQVEYDPAYFSIPYPNGDVPANKGVCTDVVIRAYRKMGIDLQKEIHEDMAANFSKYPTIWKAKSTDRNIDHRRVPNLMTFFERKGLSLPMDKNPSRYQPGEVVCWNLGGATTHIGIVSNIRSKIDSQRFQIVHNIGAGQVVEDCLLTYKIIGHYREMKR